MAKLKVAIEGCCHGELNKIYSSLPANTDLLLICGDFQALRCPADFQALNVPVKYQRLGDFHQYYTGQRVAPVLTIFIGGNHEASSYLQELKYGGWVAPNIYYLGEFGCVKYAGLRICGWSGIWNHGSYTRSSWGNTIEELIQIEDEERLPFDGRSIRSVYHQKLKAFIKMYLMRDEKNSDNCIDVVLSHDWPSGIVKYGNKHELLRKKPFFKNDLEKGWLGSPLNNVLIHHLKPKYWFSAHLHVKFEAVIKRGLEEDGGIVKKNNKLQDKEQTKTVKNVNEIEIDMDTSDEEDAKDTKSEEVTGYVNNSERLKRQVELVAAQEFTNEQSKKPKLDNNSNNNDNNNYNNNNNHNNGDSFKESHEPCETNFTALDKCGPRRQFLIVKEIETSFDGAGSDGKDGIATFQLQYDQRAIAVNRVIENILISRDEIEDENEKEEPLNLSRLNPMDVLRNPKELLSKFLPLVEKEIVALSKVDADNFFVIPANFETTVSSDYDGVLTYYPNNQTKEYCAKFGLPHLQF